MESQQSTAPGGIQVGRVQMVERTTYRLHTQAELVDLANQFRQRPGAPLAAWPLCLWALGVDSIACSDAMEKLASITTYPFQCQQQQSSWRHGAGQGSHSLMERVVAAIRTAWANAGDVSDTVSKWQAFTDLVQVLRELGMRQAMFNPNTSGPDDECFTAGMREIWCSGMLPPSSFGSLMAILTPFVGHHINDVMTMVASLVEAESCSHSSSESLCFPVEQRPLSGN